MTTYWVDWTRRGGGIEADDAYVSAFYDTAGERDARVVELADDGTVTDVVAWEGP